MTTLTQMDPEAIRQELELQRAMGTPFETAWLMATGRKPIGRDIRNLMTFMKKHFRAAYYGSDSPDGRWPVARTDTSAAVGIGAREYVATPGYERCRSGDGCDRLAVRGRFGAYWCEHHGAELDRLRESHESSRERANPRKIGNASIIKDRSA